MMRGSDIYAEFCELGLHQKALAKATGYSASAISRMLRDIFSMPARVEAEAVRMIQSAWQEFAAEQEEA